MRFTVDVAKKVFKISVNFMPLTVNGYRCWLAEVLGTSVDHQGGKKIFETDSIKSGDAAIEETREPFYKFP
jgi:hypothetical protein